MRETKFRVWNGSALEQVRKLEYDLGHGRFIANEWIDGSNLEQFTGLHDVNGKEIYEGDILLAAGSTLHFIVKWVTEWARFMLEDHRKWLVPMESSLLEVIGNIHENPELLEA